MDIERKKKKTQDDENRKTRT